MFEYSEVEQPFLNQLQALGWQLIDQGPQIPSDLTKSLRPVYPKFLCIRGLA